MEKSTRLAKIYTAAGSDGMDKSHLWGRQGNRFDNVKNQNSWKTITLKKHCQRWLNPNNSIRSDGNVCPKTSVLHHFGKKTVAIVSAQKFDRCASVLLACHNIILGKPATFIIILATLCIFIFTEWTLKFVHMSLQGYIQNWQPFYHCTVVPFYCDHFSNERVRQQKS